MIKDSQQQWDDHATYHVLTVAWVPLGTTIVVRCPGSSSHHLRVLRLQERFSILQGFRAQMRSTYMGDSRGGPQALVSQEQ